MITANRLIYNGLSSIDLDLIVDVAFDSDDGETSSFLNREAVASESYNGAFKHVHNYKWSEVFSPKFTFLKNDFSEFSESELRRIYSWLTSKSTPDFITVYHDDSEIIPWEALGGFVECTAYKIANHRTVAVVATFEATTPWAFSPLRKIIKNPSKEQDTTMYYWTSTLVNGTSVPQYILTQDEIPKVGTTVYSVQYDITEPIFKIEPTLYGTIFKVNDDNSYMVNNTTFKLTPQGTRIKRLLDNKVVINIETDDSEPIYPRIKIAQSNNVVVMIDHKMTDLDHWVEGTVYYYPNDDVYYWVDSEGVKHTSTTNSSKFITTSTAIRNIHTDDNDTVTVFDSLVKNSAAGEKIILDGANKVISSSAISRIFGDDFDFNWIPLREGKNELSFVGSCVVTIEYREVRKIGEY